MPLATSRPSPQLLVGAPLGRVHWLDLPAERPSVGASRSAVGNWLRGWRLPEESCEDAVLIVSELATNVIGHTNSERFLCCVGLTAGNLIHLEVHDHGTVAGQLLPVSAGPDDEGGRGLLLVEHLSEQWGVRRSLLTYGSVVWARLPEGRAALG
ncbi:ATP-binding protein [Streptomyces sp. NBC_01190]|uniref:ATP-binding protein n=1 Tax=Streptomyces sp. NBC_01190 TaxID=2903767 RepID=UPI0038635C23|nr:ATP-binding protein [Streptomyces sp. NBC_01190]